MSALAAEVKNLDLDDAERLAEEVRLEFWRDVFPVDPVVIAKQMDLKVIEAELPAPVSGGLLRKDGDDPVVVLNESEPKTRKRFTCAHELGHYVYRLETGCDREFEYTDLRNHLSSMGMDKEEMFANRFAGALLMPRSKVEELMKNHLPVLVMAHKFGVSADAMRVRLKVLNLFDC